LKIIHGAALASTVDAEELVNVQGIAGRASRDISRNVLASIIEPRMEEILSLVARELKKIHRSDSPGAGLVLTGGGSMLSGAMELAEQIFDMPVRIGRVNGFSHVPEEINNGRFATAHGLLVYGFSNEAQAIASGRSVRGIWRKLENWITKRF
jgi:cell division protein FtsA